MTRKKQIQSDEKFEKVDVDLFDILAAIDKKDYNYYDRLTDEQKKKVVFFMLLHWVSSIKSSGELAKYYIMSTNEYANKHLFNENIQKHPKLQWLMLCSSSPGMGKQFHQWIPHIRDKVNKYKEVATLKEVKEYYLKIFPNANPSDVNDLADEFVIEQKRKVYLGQVFPNMKISDIEMLSNLVNDGDIKEYERDRGN